VLTLNGAHRSDVLTLVTLDREDERRGYRAGRLWLFYKASSNERTFTEDELLRVRFIFL
jgi:hypothetical protein